MKTRQARKQLDRKIEKIENEIGEKELEIQSLSALLHDPANSSNFELLHESMQKLDGLKIKNEKLVDEWEELKGLEESMET